MRIYRFFGRVTAALWILMGLSSTMQAQFVISEFLASNGSSLVDEDGQSSDWIEIHNSGGTSASLGGWYLTDDPAWLTKWAFPEVSISAQGYLVVFASGKDRTNDVAWLHTNFSLDAAGEYLALVRPDGVTVAYDFAPSYPAQERDFSYGESQLVTTNVLVAGDAVVRYSVPSDGALGQNWTAALFNDSGWATGALGLGYETSVPGFSVRNFQAATTVDALSTAEQVISSPALQQWVVAENAGVINYFGSAQDGHYGNNLT
ncbi:MAG: lamin tail domain-containing protein, partial [Limisphaerales bacterium]